MLNRFQRICVGTYNEGDFAHVQSIPDARQVGDTLFVFLLIELAFDEGCDCAQEAARRIERAIVDLQDVARAIERQEPSAAH